MRLEYFRKLLVFYQKRKLPVVVTLMLGVCAAFLGGIGAGLIVPLFKSLSNTALSATAQSKIITMISAPFERIGMERRLVVVLLVFLAVIILKNMMLWANQALIKWLVYKVRFDIVSQVFAQVLRVGYRFIQSKKMGTLFTWIDQEPARTAESLGYILQLVTYGIAMLVYILILGAISWKMTVLGLFLSVVLALSLNRLSEMLRKLGEETSKTSRVLSSYWLEALQSMRIIRIFGREHYEEDRQKNVWEKFNVNALKKACYTALVAPMSEVFTTVVVVTILIFFVGFSSYAVADILPLLIAFLFVMGRIQTCAGQMNQARMNLASNLAGVRHVIEALEVNDKPYVRSGDRRIDSIQKEVRFEDVSYRYPTGEVDVLRYVNFTIPRGKVTAVVGVSGSGKSTLLDMVLRLDDPVGGRIFVDGYDLRGYRLKDWRRLIGMVDQETFIFNASVTENIRYGFLDASESDVREAAQLANAHEFISLLPDGYNTLLGDRGTRLSGGQRQRIAIARAVLRRAQLMIFDEATSSLDSESEHLIHNAIRKLSKDHTVIIVAHRLSTIVHADNIIILENGKISETGTHDVLISKKGKYYQLHQMQAKGVGAVL